jgi:uncharacterized delta-60 repeat protein
MRELYIKSYFLLLTTCFFQCVKAQNAGDLDPTFGVDGTSLFTVGTGTPQCYGLVIQPDQKIVIGGRAATGGGWYPTLVRMNPDGTPDSTFDGDGITYGDVQHTTGYAADANPLALQPDGKLLYTFTTSVPDGTALAVTRFNSDGSVDTSFGTDGTASTMALEYINEAFSLLLQADGKVVIVGRANAFVGAPLKYNRWAVG